jgi:hypothetical protein
MSLTHLSNIAKGSDFMNKSTRFNLQDANFPHALEAHVGKIILEKYVLYN